jgi:hypothetical protein
LVRSDPAGDRRANVMPYRESIGAFRATSDPQRRDRLLRRSFQAGGQPAYVQVRSRSEYPWVTAGARRCPPVLARPWHATVGPRLRRRLADTASGCKDREPTRHLVRVWSVEYWPRLTQHTGPPKRPGNISGWQVSHRQPFGCGNCSGFDGLIIGHHLPRKRHVRIWDSISDRLTIVRG